MGINLEELKLVTVRHGQLLPILYILSSVFPVILSLVLCMALMFSLLEK